MLMDGRAQKTGIRRKGDDATVLLVINGHDELVEFTLPASYGGEDWALQLDSNLDVGHATSAYKTGEQYAVTARSVLLFALLSKNAQSGKY